MNLSKKIQLLAGPLLAVLIWSFCDLIPGNPVGTRMAGIAVWMAVWWLTEVLPLAVTALLPMLLVPLMGIADSKVTAAQYMDPIIFLFIGGFIIAFAIERWKLHERIALKILIWMGTKPTKILFGVMLTTYLISMWISNTATVMMLISAVLALIMQIEKHFKEEHHSRKMATALLIGLAYSATIGGMATLVGTPTNMIFLREYASHYPMNMDMNFLAWFSVGFPISFLLLIATYFVLRFMFVKKDVVLVIDKGYFSGAYSKLGKMSYEEKTVACLFAVTVLLWFTREDIDFGSFGIKGWSNLSFLPRKEFLSDGTVAVLMAILLFIIPSRKEKGRALMIWEDVSRLPFDVVLVFGGGFALAKGIELSGLTVWLGSQLSFTAETNIYFLIFMLCILIALISEFASNVACIQLMIPVLIAIQPTLNIHPLLLLVPATMAASIGFMLPVATAPNTIVLGSKRLKVKDMLKAGLIVDFISILLITLSVWLMQKVF